MKSSESDFDFASTFSFSRLSLPSLLSPLSPLSPLPRQSQSSESGYYEDQFHVLELMVITTVYFIHTSKFKCKGIYKTIIIYILTHTGS